MNTVAGIINILWTKCLVKPTESAFVGKNRIMHIAQNSIFNSKFYYRLSLCKMNRQICIYQSYEFSILEKNCLNKVTYFLKYVMI